MKKERFPTNLLSLNRILQQDDFAQRFEILTGLGRVKKNRERLKASRLEPRLSFAVHPGAAVVIRRPRTNRAPGSSGRCNRNPCRRSSGFFPETFLNGVSTTLLLN